MWSRYYDPAIKEDFITDVLIFKEHKFFITGHNSGDIHLRKLVELKNIDIKDNGTENMSVAQSSQKSVHPFKGHSRTVTSLQPIQGKGTHFVSASVDGKIRIWCFEKMIELYCFDIAVDSPVQNSAMADSIMNIKLIDSYIYAMIFKSFIEIGRISHLATSYYISKQAISTVGKCFTSIRDQQINNPKTLFIGFNDGSIVILDPIQQSVKCTIYPPPTPSEVIKVFY